MRSFQRYIFYRFAEDDRNAVYLPAFKTCSAVNLKLGNVRESNQLIAVKLSQKARSGDRLLPVFILKAVLESQVTPSL
jgi:hypothetical protein